MTHSSRRARLVVGAALGAAASALLLSCGGGTDVAPSQPTLDEGGFASASIATLDMGQTTLVDAGVSDVVNTTATQTGEAVTVRPDGYILLANGRLSSLLVTLTGPTGTPVYCQGTRAVPCDYFLADAIAGLIEVNPAGSIPPGSDLLATYTYTRRLLEMNVGITFPDGHAVSLIIFNLPSSATAPVSSNVVVSSAPVSPFPIAFDVSVQTNLTRPTGRELLTALDDPANLLTLTDLDLTNEGDPCLAGTVTVLVRSDADPTPFTLDAAFETPGC